MENPKHCIFHELQDSAQSKKPLLRKQYIKTDSVNATGFITGLLQAWGAGGAGRGHVIPTQYTVMRFLDLKETSTDMAADWIFEKFKLI